MQHGRVLVIDGQEYVTLALTRSSDKAFDGLVASQLRRIEQVRDDPEELAAALWVLAGIYFDKGEREHGLAVLRRMDGVNSDRSVYDDPSIYFAEELLHRWDDRETGLVYLERAIQAQAGKRTTLGRRACMYSIRCLQLEIAVSEDPGSPEVVTLLSNVWRRADRFALTSESLIAALRVLVPQGIGKANCSRLLHQMWGDVAYAAKFCGTGRALLDEIEGMMEQLPHPEEVI